MEGNERLNECLEIAAFCGPADQQDVSSNVKLRSPWAAAVQSLGWAGEGSIVQELLTPALVPPRAPTCWVSRDAPQVLQKASDASGR